ITPIRLKGTFMAARNAPDKKKQPMGTPALPTAASVAIKIHEKSSRYENVMPLSMETKSTVIKMKAAQPFMLMLVQSGKAKLATLLSILARSWAQRTAVGTVALEDLVKKATVNAGIMALARPTGEIPFIFKKSGSTIKP